MTLGLETPNIDTKNKSIRKDLVMLSSLMDKNRIGALLVYCSDTNDPQDLEGIVTERDVIELISRKGKEALNNEVKEIMSKNIISVTPQCTKLEALDLMMENQIRHLAVMDEGKLVGVLSMRDLIKQL